MRQIQQLGLEAVGADAEVEVIQPGDLLTSRRF
jgi:hypothetical protein